MPVYYSLFFFINRIEKMIRKIYGNLIFSALYLKNCAKIELKKLKKGYKEGKTLK